MPGICGVADSTGLRETVGIRDKMLSLMRSSENLTECRYAANHAQVALGRVALGFRDGETLPATSTAPGLVAVMEGELYDDAPPPSNEASPFAPTRNHTERFLHGFHAGSRDYLRRLHGSFVAAVWNDAAKELLLINDRLGLRPLYYAHVGGRLLFASSLAAILADERVSREIHPRGVAQFFSFGHYFNDDTSFAAIRVLPPGACLRYDAASDRLTCERYWRIEEAYRPGEIGDRDEFHDRVDEAFCAAVRRRLIGAERVGLAISGGLDARTILGVLGEAAPHVTSICYGMSGSLDHRCSQAMAQAIGSPYHHHELNAGFLADYERHLNDMVRLTDGQYLSQCIVMPTLPLYREWGVQALLRGHAGELMHMEKAYNYSLDEHALGLRSDDALRDWLIHRLQSHMLRDVPEPMFRPALQSQLEPLARESIRDAVAATTPTPRPVDRVWQLFVQQRIRRETTLSMVKFGSVVEPRLPYLDNDLLPLLLSGPPEWKLSDTIQFHILQRRRPDFLRIVNSNTGTTMGASAWRRKLSVLRMRVFAKLGVPGYQPYERLGLWLRRELAPLVRSILLSDACLDRGVYEPDTVRAVVERHLNDRRNHTYLVMALMIFELGQRRLCDSAGRGGARNPVADVAAASTP